LQKNLTIFLRFFWHNISLACSICYILFVYNQILKISQATTSKQEELTQVNGYTYITYALWEMSADENHIAHA